ncbi:TonB family protein [Phenylobacterium sp.]|uniref:TonB family protein n=1 Tax=Phenylobacterium sp. TaxID=1871053 RepID=UPI0025E64481|nr:TonB family protein [Phenylobacterium sp.]MBX3481908.1 TonB family protein [Phenylobacterium sp.]MCW5761582.1 TonB family protein [Phenylobacterium sp.]
MWFLLIYAMFAFGTVLRDFWLLALPAALLALVVVLGLGDSLIRFALAPVLRRVWPARETRPPPSLLEEPDIHYARPPRIRYPAIAQARGQCGWVRVALRVSSDGRVLRYRALDQDPPRTFETAAATALKDARLPPGGGEREMSNLIAFVLPGADAPDWARERLAKVSGQRLSGA